MKLLRSSDLIKDDMLKWVQENLYARLGEEWDFQGADFDPLIHLLVGACASEVKNIYEAIDSADRRIVKKLAELLVPEHAHLPTPAHALASANPTGSSAKLAETMEFRCNSEAGVFYFTPAFDCVILNSMLKVVGSDELIFQYDPLQPRKAEKIIHLSKLLLGFESPKAITSFDNVLFYFNMLGENRSSLFLNAISESTWKINGRPIEKIRGFKRQSNPLQYLGNIQSPMLKQVEDIYRPNFFTTLEIPDQELFRRSITDVVISWLKESNASSPELEQQAKSLPLVDDNFFWIEIQLPYTIPVYDFINNFRCATNIFPIVNRKLNVKDDADVFFNRPVLDAVSIMPDKPFLGVHSVLNIENKESLEILPLNQLNGSRKPAYSMRYAGVGRIDNFNIWSRFAYMLGLFREEHRYNEVLEKLGTKMSIEDLHLLIGEKILQEEPSQATNHNTLYLFINPGQSQKNGLRVCIKYWTTNGSKANRISSNKVLVCDPADPSIMKENFVLYTSPKGGRDAAEETDYYNHLRNNLNRHGKIVTTEDVKRFCFEHLGENLKKVTIMPGFYVDPRAQGSIMRALEVFLDVDDVNDTSLNESCRELDHLINEKSNGSIPYIVKIQEVANG